MISLLNIIPNLKNDTKYGLRNHHLNKKHSENRKKWLFAVYVLRLGFLGGGSDPTQAEEKGGLNHPPILDEFSKGTTEIKKFLNLRLECIILACFFLN